MLSQKKKKKKHINTAVMKATILSTFIAYVNIFLKIPKRRDEDRGLSGLGVADLLCTMLPH